MTTQTVEQWYEFAPETRWVSKVRTVDPAADFLDSPEAMPIEIR